MKKVFNFFLIIFCSSLLVWQSYENIKTYLSHPTAQRMSSQSLLNSGFPKIEICLTPGFDLDFLNSIGYETLTDFAKGIVKYEGQPSFGWIGNGSNKIDQAFENASMLKNFRSITKSFALNHGDENETDSLEIKERKFRYPDGKCFDLNIKLDASKDYEQNAELKITFQEYGNNTVNIKITDPNREYFLSDEFTFFGKDIKKHPNPNNAATLDIYRVQIRENVDLEEDEEANCEDYEKENKDSFKQCVQSVVEKQFLGQFSCLPPWFTENLADLCDSTYTKEQWKNMSELIFYTMDNTFLKVKTLKYRHNQNIYHLGMQGSLQNNGNKFKDNQKSCVCAARNQNLV